MPLYKVEIKSPFIIRCDEGEVGQVIDNLSVGDVCTDDDDYTLTEIKSKSQLPIAWNNTIPFGDNTDELACKDLINLPLLKIMCDECEKTASLKCTKCEMDVCEKCAKEHKTC